jgi:(2R)-sulfolactate sulfo-lyase subunit alpha
MSTGSIDAVVHRDGDDVAMTVVAGLVAGTTLRCWVMDRDEVVSVVPRVGVPLGHKVAMRAIARGARVMKYGSPIGEATADIAAGDHVHVHNLRSLRW